MCDNKAFSDGKQMEIASVSASVPEVVVANGNINGDAAMVFINEGVAMETTTLPKTENEQNKGKYTDMLCILLLFFSSKCKTG